MEAVEISSSSWVNCRVWGPHQPLQEFLSPPPPSRCGVGGHPQPLVSMLACTSHWAMKWKWKEEVISEWKLQESTEALSSSLLLLPFDQQCAIWQMLCHLEAHRMKKMN